MAIGTDAIVPFFGTTDALDDTSTSAITNGAMSVAADVISWPNTDDAPHANAILRFQHASGALTGHVNLHIRPMNVDGTDDVPAPDAADPLNYIGTFEINADKVTATDNVYIRAINLLPWIMETSQNFEFYIFNDTGQTISANWDLDIVPIALGLKA